MLLDEFITWAFVKPEVARAPNQQSISGLVEKVHPCVYSHAFKLVATYGEEWIKNFVLSAKKHGNSAAAHARKVLSFYVTNELGLENYFGYQCTKFGENR